MQIQSQWGVVQSKYEKGMHNTACVLWDSILCVKTQHKIQDSKRSNARFARGKSCELIKINLSNKTNHIHMPFNKLFAYLGDNATQIDSTEYEAELREKDPRLLQHDESIVFAFKGRGGKGRDHEMFTTKRILIRDKRGATGKRTRYVSVPYKSIRAFSVETTGTVDADSELKIYARGIGKVSMDFVCDVDVLVIHRFLSEMVIRGDGAGMESNGAVAHDTVNTSGGTGFFDLVGSNYSQLNPADIEAKLRGIVLMSDEKVELGFQCGRDSFVMTNKRVLKVDVQGVTGKKIEYLTILWPAIKGFSGEYSMMHFA